MPNVRANSEKSVLIVIDEQPAFLAAIHEAERVVRRSQFLLGIAKLVGVPVAATEQYPERMGPTDPRIACLFPLGVRAVPKMSFSCCGCDDFVSELARSGRKQAILIGIETHICVSQTALDLMQLGWEVVVCPDAVSARSLEMHKLGMERMRDAGIVPAHTEAIAYEWLGSASHPRFREALQIVKDSAT